MSLRDSGVNSGQLYHLLLAVFTVGSGITYRQNCQLWAVGCGLWAMVSHVGMAEVSPVGSGVNSRDGRRSWTVGVHRRWCLHLWAAALSFGSAIT